MKLIMGSLSERIEALQNLLIVHATGGSADPGEYKKLRQEIVNDPLLKDVAPPFLKTCRTSAEFWHFIKYQFQHYSERREFIWNSFHPFFERLDAENSTPADQSVAVALEKFDPETVHRL